MDRHTCSWFLGHLICILSFMNYNIQMEKEKSIYKKIIYANHLNKVLISSRQPCRSFSLHSIQFWAYIQKDKLRADNFVSQCFPHIVLSMPLTFLSHLTSISSTFVLGHLLIYDVYIKPSQFSFCQFSLIDASSSFLIPTNASFPWWYFCTSISTTLFLR